MMIKSIKVMLLPNNVQKTRLFQHAGAARFMYNWALGREEENYEAEGKFLTYYDLMKEVVLLKKTDEYAWLKDISATTIQGAVRDATDAYINFFKKRAKHPRFKSRKNSTPSFSQTDQVIEFSDTHVKLSCLSNSLRKNRKQLNWVRLAEHGKIPMDKKHSNPRITFDGINWWISVGIEYPDRKNELSEEGLGVDMGIRNLAVCSDESIYPNINRTKAIKDLEKRKRRLQRSISRKYEQNKKEDEFVKTKNIIKSEKKLLKMQHRLNNIRKNYLHNTSKEIVGKNPKFICIENLDIKGMMKNKYMAKDFQDQALYEFGRQLEYKSNFKSIPFIRADKFFASSKTCSRCGKIKKDLKPQQKTFRCECGNVIDVHKQAALNLKTYGEAKLAE